MSDILHYFLAHARTATQKARTFEQGSASRRRQRTVARVYHLLAKEAAYTSNVDRLDEFRTANRFEKRIGRR
jgi:hypothetical protein